MMSLLIFITTLYSKRLYYLPNRTMWIDVRQQTFWEKIVMGKWLRNLQLLDERWQKEFRMTYRQFCKLVDMLSPFIQKEDTNMRAAIPNNKTIAIALHRLGYGGTFYMAGHHLENSPSTSSKFTHNICEVIVTHFYDRYIQIPKGEALQEIMARFESLKGIPYMWGAIDGSHIRLTKKPSDKEVPSDYFNRLKSHSLLLQGVCDHKQRFLNVCVKALVNVAMLLILGFQTYGKTYKHLDCPIKNHFKIGNEDVQSYLLGDSAYPLQINLMKCFS